MDQLPTPAATTPTVIDDASAMRRVYDEHGATVFRFCSQTLPAHLAEEATQDVFVQAWRNRHRFDAGRGSMVAWLIGIAKLRVIDLARHERRHSTRRANLDEHGSNTPPAPSDDDIERLANKAIIAQALRSLPERQRQAVAMAYVEGLTHREIADRTGNALGTVKSDIRRGLEAIRHQMEGVGA